jgi:SAM-dependent methyltransferase
MAIRWLHTHFGALRQALARLTYEYVSLRDQDGLVLFMNYGYANLEPDAARVELTPEDEATRYEIQLYHHIASAVRWEGRDALEVSSGRGGGASYVSRSLSPRSLTGLDLSIEAVRFCIRRHRLPGLSFVHGRAEDLHFPDEAFDVVLNVEASFYYADFERFLSEVVRVLRPGGYFLYADMRYAEELEKWRAQLDATGLELRNEEDITPNVIRALELMHDHRRELVWRLAPAILRRPFAGFAGVTGAGLVAGPPRIGSRTYRNYVLQKPAH